MKITIVCGHYLPQLGYLEVHLARAFQRLGHEVSVVTSTVVPGYVRNKFSEPLKAGIDTDERVTIYRLKPFIAIGQIVLAHGVKSTLQQIKPNLILIIGLGKIFPKPALDIDLPIGLLLGDNSHTYLNLNFKQRIIRSLFKKPVYEQAIQKAKKVFTYTPETADVLKPWIGTENFSLLQPKQVSISLGFDNKWFYFDEKVRLDTRKELGIDDSEMLVITAARMGGNKNFKPLFSGIEKLSSVGEKIKCLVVGLAEDEASQQARNRLQNSPHQQSFITREFVSRDKLNALYNAADIGYWPITAISVFEGIGTGLYLLLPADESLRHLELNGENGLFTAGDISDKLRNAIMLAQQKPRQLRAESAVEKFSYQSIAQRILQSMQSG